MSNSRYCIHLLLLCIDNGVDDGRGVSARLNLYGHSLQFELQGNVAAVAGPGEKRVITGPYGLINGPAADAASANAVTCALDQENEVTVPISITSPDINPPGIGVARGA